MRVLLEFGCFCLLVLKFTLGLIRIRVLFEGGPLSKIYGMYYDILFILASMRFFT